MSTSLLLRNMTLILGVWLMLAGVCFGKQVYMKDGSVIECESVRLSAGQVVVKINRDIVLDFARSEVDLKRTFPGAGKKPGQAKSGKTAATVVRGLAAAPAPAPAPAESTSATAAKADSAATGDKTAPTAKVATPPAAKPVQAANPSVQPAPAQPAQATQTDASSQAEVERRTRKAADMMAAAVAQKSPMPGNTAVSVVGGGLYLLAMAAFLIAVVASLWVVFNKAGRSGILSLIPLYNLYVLMEISGKPGWWMLLMFIPGVGFVFYLLAMFGLAQKFGKGALHALGLFFLPMFFFPLLAFSSAEYED